MAHVADMAESVAFYEALGASVLHGSRDGDFVMLDIGGSQLSLLAHPPNPEHYEGQVELNFEADGDLEELEAGCATPESRLSPPPPTRALASNFSWPAPTAC